MFLVKKDLHIKKIGRKLGSRILSPAMKDAFPVGGGADVVIDSVGNTSSLSNSIRLIKPKGKIILIGAPAYMEIDWSPLVAREINILPSMAYSNEIINNKKARTFQITLDLIASGQVDINGIFTHKFPIDNYKEALFRNCFEKNVSRAIKTAFFFE